MISKLHIRLPYRPTVSGRSIWHDPTQSPYFFHAVRLDIRRQSQHTCILNIQQNIQLQSITDMQDGTVTYNVTYNITNVDSALQEWRNLWLAQAPSSITCALRDWPVAASTRAAADTGEWRQTPLSPCRFPQCIFFFPLRCCFGHRLSHFAFILSVSERCLLWWCLNRCPSYPPPFLITESPSFNGGGLSVS